MLPQCALIVDDEPMVRRLISLMLETTGYQTRHAASVREAMGCLTPDCPLPSVLLLDRNLGGPSGDTLLDWIETQPHLAQLPVVLMSGQEAGNTRAEAASPRVVGVLPKPFSPDDLLASISQVA